jgi:hypothetical protein
MIPTLGVASFYKDADASARSTGSPKHHNYRGVGRRLGAGLSSVSSSVSEEECILKRVRGGVYPQACMLVCLYAQACMLVCMVLLLLGLYPQAYMLVCMVLLLLGVYPYGLCLNL